MTTGDLLSEYFIYPNGMKLGLSINRIDEQQRGQRLYLPKSATCLDYAPLIDIVAIDSESGVSKFTGLTAAKWLMSLHVKKSSEFGSAKQWFESECCRFQSILDQLPRIPDNHYCIQVANPPLKSTLPEWIKSLRLGRAIPDEWIASIKALTGKGLKPEELEMSGVLIRLRNVPMDTKLSLMQVLGMVELNHLIPKFASESSYGYVVKGGWNEVCQRISEKDYRRRKLIGKGHKALHLIRYKHKSLGWTVMRSKYQDLFTERAIWWSVSDQNEKLLQPTGVGFETVDEAINFAENQISRRFWSWGKNHPKPSWEYYSLPSSDHYQEVLLQLDNWPLNYKSEHYRTRNILAHIRISMRKTVDQRKILYLDEVQSDWHADLHFATKTDNNIRQIPNAPFHKDWPLLSMKLMIWWAQKLDADGLGWSTVELQMDRWRGHGPPILLYSNILPEIASKLSVFLGAKYEKTKLSIRQNNRRVVFDKTGWLVKGSNNAPITKPFLSRAQAEFFADQIANFYMVEVPVIWLNTIPKIKAIPLYGLGTKDFWFG